MRIESNTCKQKWRRDYREWETGNNQRNTDDNFHIGKNTIFMNQEGQQIPINLKPEKSRLNCRTPKTKRF